MNAFAHINENAATEFGQADFAAAAEAGRTRRAMEARQERTERQRDLQQAVAAFIQSREPETDADLEEAELHIGDAIHLATTLRALCDMVEPTFAKLQREKLAEAEPQFLGILADAFSDRLSDELTSVFRAALRMGVQ